MESEETRNILMTRMAELIDAYEQLMECTVGCEVTFFDRDIPITADYNNEINYSYNGQEFVTCDKE
jgi:hypothetical protein